MINKSFALTAALLAATITNAGAAIAVDTQTGGSATAFDGNISSTDLINVGQTATYSSVASSEGTTFGSATSANDGSASTNSNVIYDNSVSSSPITFTYTLNTSVNTLGYDITSIRTIYGWTSAGSFGDQIYSVSYATVGSPATYNVLENINFDPATSVHASQITITEDATGVLASGVSSIRFALATNPANNQVGIAREFDVEGIATVAVPEPSAFGLLAGMFGLTWVMLRRRA